MGTVYRETYTKPVPKGAELFTRNGQRFARWIDGNGRKRVEKVSQPSEGKHAGQDRIQFKAGTFTAKYRDGSGRLRKVTTGCRSLDAARSVLVELETRADKVRSGGWTAAEDAVLDHQAAPLGEHIATYLDHLKNKRGKGSKRRVSTHHVRNVKINLQRIIADCRFQLLRDLNREAVEKWADRAESDGMGARTINAHLAAITAFGNWAVRENRLVSNPFALAPKRDEKADRRRERRALTEDELRRLLKVARLRPIAEYGRRKVKLPEAPDRTNKKGRRTWKLAPLDFDDLDSAAERGRESLSGSPDVHAELEQRGRERALIYKMLVLTGLRKGELAAVSVRNLELDDSVPYLVLDAADEKAGRGAEIPLRRDLAADLERWLSDALAMAQDRARANERPIPARLPLDTRVVNVPEGLGRILDRDLVVAGIARLVTDSNGRQKIDKRDDRGRTIDVHALRHTFGTHLSKGGVAPRTAQAAMRHSTIDLTMSTYTDPRLLDVAGAMNALPELPLSDDPRAESAKATGTDATPLVPVLGPTHGKPSASNATADKTSERTIKGPSPASDTGDKPYARLSNDDKKRATRLERATFSLEG